MKGANMAKVPQKNKDEISKKTGVKAADSQTSSKKEAKLFGTDGVRGRAGEVITPSSVIALGTSAGIHFRQHSLTNKILVGKDTRRSGYMIENALVSALTSVGYDVIQIGPMPTPAVAFLTEDMRCDAGIMISASHNPYDDNGIKFFNHYGYKLAQEEEESIESYYYNPTSLQSALKSGLEIGSSKRIDDVVGRYIVHIKNSFPKNLTLRGLRIVCDCANGAAYRVAPIVLSELGADVIAINDEPNGYNINKQCGAMHPETLAQEVRTYRADVGFALDGDADRLVVVDNEGHIINGDKLIGALALYQKQIGALKNNAIVTTLMSNLALEEFLKSHNITLYRCNVGDKYVWDMMKERDLNFGGESSGHIIFSDYAKTGDGLVSALQVLALLLQSKKNSHEALNPFELYPSELVNLKVAHKKPLESIAGLKEKLDSITQSGNRHLVRYSGTENKLRILVEGKDSKLVSEQVEILTEFFQKQLNV
ncbi:MULTISPECIES: phosphoglucosamine mutase [Helicobacter]|uniref:Phosphoglucosamine mutase n=3 Tax=Helicobacter typhlonius TaxID=76936 RepID=A0A0S4PUU1_9HELI|nr:MULTISPECIES: phosphoglucosamine mutase [Helicobacter]CUU40095.1 Phosphoglucosamine mutase [Helicobacter typhlonius]